MTRKRVLTLWLLLFSLLAQSFAGREAHGLSPQFSASFRRQLNFIVARNPRYVWGGSNAIESGLDCSGYIYLAAKWAGLPGITRTTSSRMAQGLGGWTSISVNLESAEELDLVFWTFSVTRPDGHVGAFLKITPNGRVVTHASSSRGVIAEPLGRRLTETISRVRRLNMGD